MPLRIHHDDFPSQPDVLSDDGERMLMAARAEYRNYRSLVERAVDVFGDELKASLWLSSPSADLDGLIPMQVAQRVKYSAEEIERIFEPVFLRIEHGIYT